MQITVNTMESQEQYAGLSLSDLSSGADFKKWLKNNLVYYSTKEVPDKDLLIYINYIRDKAKESSGINLELWLNALNDLEKRIEAINEF